MLDSPLSNIVEIRDGQERRLTMAEAEKVCLRLLQSTGLDGTMLGILLRKDGVNVPGTRYVMRND